ncbi:MAG: SseB family protein [Streptosporangiaceae bacterium]
MSADSDGQPSQPATDIETALAALDEHDDQTGFLRSLAAGQVVLPQMEPGGSDEEVKLPFIEQEGTRYVLAFSSAERLTESGIEAQDSVTVTGAELGASWPTDDEMWLAINPSSERGVTVPPDAVRALPSLATSG